MIGAIVLKEIKLKILDLRFVISTLIVLLLVIFSVIILSENYQKEISDYQTALKNDESALKGVQVFSVLEPKLHYPPNPLSIFNTGVSGRINKTVTIQYHSVPRQSPEVISENPLLKIYRPFDLTTVFRLVLSLLAIILVYDSFSGEKEVGTLKLMLSNGVKRRHILLAKLFSNAIILIIPVIISFLVSLVIITGIYGVNFSGIQWIRIGLIILSTIVFLSFFIALGLLISSMTAKSSVSLILLASLWVLFCILQPNLGSYVASSVINIPSKETMDNAYAENWNEFSIQQQRILEQIDKKIPPGHQDGNVAVFGGEHGYVVSDGTTPLLMKFLYRTMENEPLRHQYAEKEWDIYRQRYLPSLEKQHKLQDYIDYLSPAALFQLAASSISQTDVDHYDHFLNAARTYRSTLMNYLKDDRKLFSNNAHEYFTRLSRDEFDNSQYNARINAKSDNRFSNTPPLDLSGLPEFSFQSFPLSDTITHVLNRILLVLVYTGTIIIIAAGRFKKYDVR